jgi:NTP pyrophosphatase (non-canonical NTP hydrolase)
MSDSLVELTARLRAFADARDWQQFHSPKNLAMAIAAEVGELLEHFQWLTESSRELSASAREEVGESWRTFLISRFGWPTSCRSICQPLRTQRSL